MPQNDGHQEPKQDKNERNRSQQGDIATHELAQNAELKVLQQGEGRSKKHPNQEGGCSQEKRE